MDATLAAALRAGRGVVTLAAVAGVAPSWALANACRAGTLVRLFPAVYVDAALAADRLVRQRAALAYARGAGALSHTSALAVWGLGSPACDGQPVHLTVPADVRLRSRPELVLHRCTGFAPRPPAVVVRRGLPVVRLERALVESWALLDAEDRHAPVIRAVGDRLTTPDRLAAAVEATPRLPGRAELVRLVDLLAAGCRSPLEIWGHDHVFSGPGMPAFRRQAPVRLGDRTVYLDVYAEPQRVDFELDGAAHHGDPSRREADLRRDNALAARGIMVVRFTHRRLVRESRQVRAEIEAILRDRSPVTCRIWPDSDR